MIRYTREILKQMSRDDLITLVMDLQWTNENLSNVGRAMGQTLTGEQGILNQYQRERDGVVDLIYRAVTEAENTIQRLDNYKALQDAIWDADSTQDRETVDRLVALTNLAEENAIATINSIPVIDPVSAVKRLVMLSEAAGKRGMRNFILYGALALSSNEATLCSALGFLLEHEQPDPQRIRTILGRLYDSGFFDEHEAEILDRAKKLSIIQKRLELAGDFRRSGLTRGEYVEQNQLGYTEKDLTRAVSLHRAIENVARDM